MKKKAFSYVQLLIIMVFISVFLVMTIRIFQPIKDEYGNDINTRTGKFVDEYDAVSGSAKDIEYTSNMNSSVLGNIELKGQSRKDMSADPLKLEISKETFNKMFDSETRCTYINEHNKKEDIENCRIPTVTVYFELHDENDNDIGYKQSPFNKKFLFDNGQILVIEERRQK